MRRRRGGQDRTGEEVRGMGDARRIDHLRALALSSMPSMARRPAQRRDSGIIDIFEQRKALVSAFPAIPDDKEEGELSSSDDETEHTATNPAAAVSLPYTCSAFP